MAMKIHVVVFWVMW